MVGIPRVSLDDVFEPGGLAWAPDYPAAIIRCPNGHVTGIGNLRHRIDSGGAVHPSVVCNGGTDEEPCDFHEYVRLVGWEA